MAEFESVVDVVKDYLSSYYTQYQWKVEWNKKQQIVELYFLGEFVKPNNLILSDDSGNVSTGNQLLFEQLICFYDDKKSAFDPESYLEAFPNNHAEGFEVGYIQAILKQVNLVLAQQRSDIEEFINNPQIDEFEGKWQGIKLDQTIQSLKDIGRYDSRLVPLCKKLVKRQRRKF